MKPRPILAATALVVFGYVAITTQSAAVFRISLFVMANAFMCHVMGNIDWDIFCNVVFVAVSLLTSRKRRRLAPIIGIATATWLVNNYIVKSAVVHAVIQGLGAYTLITWNCD